MNTFHVVVVLAESAVLLAKLCGAICPLRQTAHYQSTLDAVHVYVVPWSEFPIILPSLPTDPLACPLPRRERGVALPFPPHSRRLISNPSPQLSTERERERGAAISSSYVRGPAPSPRVQNLQGHLAHHVCPPHGFRTRPAQHTPRMQPDDDRNLDAVI